VTGAGSPSITVPVTEFPPTTALASSTNCSGGSRLSTAVELRRPSVAVSVTVWTLVTGRVVIVKSTELWPKGTVTNGGTRALSLSLLSWTLTPPAGALLVNVTVPVRSRPPEREGGGTDTPASC